MASGNSSVTAFNIGTLLLRVCFAAMLMHHGFDKLMHYGEMKGQFMQFMGLSSSITLSLTIFAEFFCSILLILGFLTRWAAIPIVIEMLVAVTMAHNGDIFDKGEKAALYLIAAVVILIIGPGRYSIDGMMGRR